MFPYFCPFQYLKNALQPCGPAGPSPRACSSPRPWCWLSKPEKHETEQQELLRCYTSSRSRVAESRLLRVVWLTSHTCIFDRRLHSSGMLWAIYCQPFAAKCINTPPTMKTHSPSVLTGNLRHAQVLLPLLPVLLPVLLPLLLRGFCQIFQDY